MDLDEQFKLEHIKCANQLRIEEFKDRRSEIDVLIKDTKNLEIYAAAGVVIYYAWLLTHCVPLTGLPRVIPWLIPVGVPVLGAWRCVENVAQILNIAGYILAIEKQLAQEGLPIGPQNGWEHYLKSKRRMEVPPDQNIYSTAWQEVRNVWKVEYSKARIFFWSSLIGLTLAMLVTSVFVQLSSCSAADMRLLTETWPHQIFAPSSQYRNERA